MKAVICCLALASAGWSAKYQTIVIAESAHPAVRAAGEILARTL